MDTTNSSEELQAPYQDVVSFAFDRQKVFDEGKPLYINADDPRQFLNYAQTLRFVRQLIAGLKTGGLEDGDTVLVHLFNNYIYAPLFLAIVGAGGTFCATNPSLKSELKNVFNLSQPRFIITTDELLARLREWVPDIELDHVIILDTHQPLSPNIEAASPEETTSRSLNSMLSCGEADWKRVMAEDVKGTPAAYFLTSGTTGPPKLAVLSHYSMVAHFCQIHQEVPYDVVRLGCLPLFHMFGGAWALALTVRHGQPIYIMPRFAMDNYLEYIEKYNVTESCLAPPVVMRLIGLESDAATRLNSLRFVGVGGAPITAAAMRTFRATLHKDATLSGIYGATEIGTVCMLRYEDKDDLGCVGRPLPGVRIALQRLQANDETCESDHGDDTGEIVVSASSHMMGYRDSAEKSTIGLEWYSTGDLGRVKDGRLYIMGKTKDIMKVNGFQVSPTEIEAVLLAHPDIIDCAVSKIVRGGMEMPRAYIVRRSRMISATAIAAYSHRQLVSYKALTGGIAFVTKIPKLPSGKIQRHKLEEMPGEVDMDNGLLSSWRAWTWVVRTCGHLLTRTLAGLNRNWITKPYEGST